MLIAHQHSAFQGLVGDSGHIYLCAERGGNRAGCIGQLLIFAAHVGGEVQGHADVEQGRAVFHLDFALIGTPVTRGRHQGNTARQGLEVVGKAARVLFVRVRVGNGFRVFEFDVSKRFGILAILMNAQNARIYGVAPRFDDDIDALAARQQSRFGQNLDAGFGIRGNVGVGVGHAAHPGRKGIMRKYDMRREQQQGQHQRQTAVAERAQGHGALEVQVGSHLVGFFRQRGCHLLGKVRRVGASVRAPCDLRGAEGGRKVQRSQQPFAQHGEPALHIRCHADIR